MVKLNDMYMNIRNNIATFSLLRSQRIEGKLLQLHEYVRNQI